MQVDVSRVVVLGFGADWWRLTSLSEVWSSWVVVSMPVSTGGVSVSFCYSVREVRLVRGECICIRLSSEMHWYALHLRIDPVGGFGS